MISVTIFRSCWNRSLPLRIRFGNNTQLAERARNRRICQAMPRVTPAVPPVFAGQRRAYDAVCALVGGFTEHADVLKAWRVRPPAGLLLYGPPGTGKTHVVRAAAAAFALPLLVLQGSSGASGDELCARLRTVFAQAEAEAEAATIARGRATPALLFMDELDTLCPKRSDAGSSDSDRRAVAQLLTLLDGVTPRQRVIAVAATNRAHGIDGVPPPGPTRAAPPLSLAAAHPE